MRIIDLHILYQTTYRFVIVSSFGVLVIIIIIIVIVVAPHQNRSTNSPHSSSPIYSPCHKDKLAKAVALT